MPHGAQVLSREGGRDTGVGRSSSIWPNSRMQNKDPLERWLLQKPAETGGNRRKPAETGGNQRKPAETGRNQPKPAETGRNWRKLAETGGNRIF